MPLAKPIKRKRPAIPAGHVKKTSRIVAIGASAGGLEAVTSLLSNLPPNTGMSFIYVQHLSPDHPSSLAELLATTTEMNVQEVVDKMELEPNNIYVCIPNKEITVANRRIKLKDRGHDVLPYLPIDAFFTSLAARHKNEVVGIVLSGNATDGTKGLMAIKSAGGITFAQDASAKYPNMPRSAIDEGTVDFILSPKKIAAKLVAIGRTGKIKHSGLSAHSDSHNGDDDANLKKIFEILHQKTGVDFGRYKIASLRRRLTHRMLVCGSRTIREYVKLLSKRPGEADDLYKDLLINVTSFFRDPATFEFLKNSLLPTLLKTKKSGETLRIWVPACSKGAEVYSIAMIIAELQEDKISKIPVQIFATDLSERSIREARVGRYTKNDVMPISKARLLKFFNKIGDEYEIKKELRDLCVFAPHNILSDPPFLRMDFISCRNLLIYFDAQAQKKVLSTLSYVLNDRGFLMLGKAETTGVANRLFEQVSPQFKIYSKKKDNEARRLPQLDRKLTLQALSKKNNERYLGKIASVIPADLDSSIDHFLLANNMPACAIINAEMEILQFRGATSLYLSHPSGKASFNILKLVKPEVAFQLRNAITEVIRTKGSLQKGGIEVKTDLGFQIMTVEVSPIKVTTDEMLLIVVFTSQKLIDGPHVSDSNGDSSGTDKLKIKRLTEELRSTRSEIHAVIDSQEKAYEKLQAANEEIVSTNEEFQTLNEELETSKEEIEATNEELTSTNQELKTHNDLLAESYEYSQTIISTIHEPLLILDSDLKIKFANKSFYKKFNAAKETTEGEYLFKLGNKQWNIPALRKLLETMLDRNTNFENFEVTHTFPEIGKKTMLLNANRLIQKTHKEKLILLAIEDITERSMNQRMEKQTLESNILAHEKNKGILENEVKIRTVELELKNSALENANKDLISFTHISSHDLQEPLRKIQNFVDRMLAEESQTLSEQGKDYLTRTYDTAKRMRALIDDLLSYSSTKNTDRKYVTLNLKDIVDQIQFDNKDLMAEKKAKIKLTKLCMIHVIEFQFLQLFQNLIANSLKFSKKKVAPIVTIHSSIVLGSRLHGGKILSDKKYCHIIYTDNGIGFEPEYNERVFEVFQRLHTRDEYKGTGIGLAICKRIVENHKGIITATGRRDKGARFDIYIPAS